MTARPTIDPDAVSLEHVPFENTFVRDLPADPVATNVPRQVRERELHARRADAGGGAAAACVVR